MNAQPQLDEVDRPRATMKFTYPSGSRPLDGYTIKRGVGRGGFGEVYFATSDAGKEVALKLIRRNLDVELRGVTQCLNLKHPNLIALYDIRTDTMGDQWVVMEYVSGESLEEVIERNPNGMPPAEALWWMRGICAGVAYLHDHGIVHRDLKPGNIFSDEGTVKIGDYGLAKFISCSRRSGQTESVGTVHYMAPEIANGRYGREIDTYALGIILFEMLTGHVPFEGESVGEVLMKHLTAEPDLSSLADPYRGIVERALAKDPGLRIKDVAELVSLLPGGDGLAPPLISSIDLKPVAAAALASAKPATPPIEHVVLTEVTPRSRAQVAHAAAAHEEARIEEPIWKAIRETFSGMNLKDATPLKKALFIFFVVVVCTQYGNAIAGLVIPLAVCYAIYYIIWTSIHKPKQQAAAKLHAKPRPNQRANGLAGLNPATDSDKRTVAWPVSDESVVAPSKREQRAAQRRIRSSWRDRANQELAAKPLHAKVSELLGSMLMATLFATLAACVAPLLLRNEADSEQMASFIWLALVGSLGAWAVLVPSKFTEGKVEDNTPHRVSLLLLGTLVGVAAWGLGEVLMLKSPGWREPVDVGTGLITHEMLGWQHDTNNVNPPIAVYMAYFAFLFLVPRWWRQSEFTRAARVSLWSVIACVGWAWLLHMFWWFPQPLGMMAAGVIAVATQLASPWMPPSQRRALSELPKEGAA
ncbi:MAG: serine/threonine-protein kinase [Pirellulales bacterium]